MTREIILVNANVLQPPVSPVGLEYVAESVMRAGLPLRVIDLAFEKDWQACLRRELRPAEALLVGVSVRNTDDCSFISGKSFLPWINEVITEIKKHTDAPVFLGGVGFSVMPDIVMGATGADGGIEGDGEDAVVALAEAILHKDKVDSLPNLVYRKSGAILRNPRKEVNLTRLPAFSRSVFSNRQYEMQGAMVGIETKRGCGQICVYCADPIAKGAWSRLRPPKMVAKEFENLVAQGVTWFHLCDSEFNLPLNHAKDVCRALIENGLGNKIRWYTYCAPVPFDPELLSLMKSAGCAGINFGVDSLDDGQLRRLGRHYSSDDIRQLVGLLNQERFNYLFDFMIGAPGETPETVQTTIERVKQYGIKAAGIAIGVRVYPGTRLARKFENDDVIEGLHPARDRRPETPLFYLSPALGEDVTGFIRNLVGGDPRFLVLATPGEKGSYNYAGDDLLSHLIQEGARGAYWDILRKHAGR
ncbi:MAG TPA: radical SAM protein [Dehalococcoidales bacterium]